MLTLTDLVVDRGRPVTLTLAIGDTLALLCRPLRAGTVLLEALAGRRAATAGLACLDGRPVAGPGLGSIHRDPRPRPDPTRVGLASPRDPLLPHLDVAANIALPLRLSGHDRRQSHSQTAEVMALLGLEPVASNRPGGLAPLQAIRVRTARALSCRPGLLLVDNPGAGLSPPDRADLLAHLRRLARARALTVVLTTDDAEEALAFGSQVGLLDEGTLRQAGSPSELLDAPLHAAVAQAFGQANLLTGQVIEAGDDSFDIRLAAGPVIEAMPPVRAEPAEFSIGGLCEVAIRPDRLAVAFVDRLPVSPERGDIPATLVDAQPLGERVRLRFRLADGVEIVAHRPAQTIRGRLERDRPALLACQARDAIAFPLA